MEHTGKENSPYKGIWWSLFFLIFVPVILYFTIFGAAKAISKMSTIECRYIALMFGFGVGSLFHMTLILSGLIKESFIAVCVRVGHFFQNLKVNAKFAFKYYWFELKDTGCVFWIYLLPIVTSLTVCIVSVVKYFDIFL